MRFFRFNTRRKEEQKPTLREVKAAPAPVQEVKAAPEPKKKEGKKSSKRPGVRPDPRVPLTNGTELEGYKFERVIGRGSFSLVYRAMEMESGYEVVIKEYFPKHFSIRKDDNSITPLDGKKLYTFSEGFKQFFTEAMALNKISHPHVLKTHNMFRANKTAYLVSLNIGGRDLKWFLGTVRKPMDQPLVYKVFMPILSALNFMHGAHLLHLDIKPANILLQPNSESLLLDFGAAARMNSSKRVNNMQTLTHGFAPPEQYDKNKSLGPWTDIYAVAATLYYSITCKPPAKSKDNDTESKLSLDTYSKKYEPYLLQAVNRCLAYDASNRYDNVDDFAKALLEGSPWDDLLDYELKVMNFDRFNEDTLKAQETLRFALEVS